MCYNTDVPREEANRIMKGKVLNMATSKKVLDDGLRAQFMERIKAFFEAEGEEVLITGNGEISMPCVDAEGNDKWVQIPVKVPTGSRDGEPFDGYSLAEDFQMKQAEKKAKAEEAAKKKAEKIAKDKASREAKAAAREKAKAAKA